MESIILFIYILVGILIIWIVFKILRKLFPLILLAVLLFFAYFFLMRERSEEPKTKIQDFISSKISTFSNLKKECKKQNLDKEMDCFCRIISSNKKALKNLEDKNYSDKINSFLESKKDDIASCLN